uniref:Scyllo-inositol 2-dehydrogenase (NAD(+)) n=1 Tax=Thermosporothrix sp. COM3 TaxID=2490863 RepID=A0A455SFW3_9CHLR|nr:scyllo-inositol 2-dehydrogenase (NAD(+)) [Thermosporothrix sp. COM3]
MAAPIHIGVIGLGRMGMLYARLLATQVEGARLIAVADTNRQVCEQAVQAFSVRSDFTDPTELLRTPGLDAVLIATPTSTHAELILAAAQAGKAIFCEKPLALTYEEHRRLLQAVEQARVPLQVGFMRRFDAAYQQAKALIEEGRIGRPTTFKAISRDPFCPRPEFADPTKSGGLIVDMGIHDFDLARWLVGSEVERVSAEGSLLVCQNLAAVGDIDNALVTLRFASGALGNVEVSRNAFYGYDIRTEVLGSEGAVLIGAHQHTPLLFLDRTGAQHDVQPYLSERFGNAYLKQLQHFVDCLRHDQPPAVGGADALAACEIALAATEACRIGHPLSIEAFRQAHQRNKSEIV